MSIGDVLKQIRGNEDLRKKFLDDPWGTLGELGVDVDAVKEKLDLPEDGDVAAALKERATGKCCPGGG